MQPPPPNQRRSTSDVASAALKESGLPLLAGVTPYKGFQVGPGIHLSTHKVKAPPQVYRVASCVSLLSWAWVAMWLGALVGA
jgi:hypothetical protein